MRNILNFIFAVFLSALAQASEDEVVKALTKIKNPYLETYQDCDQAEKLLLSPVRYSMTLDHYQRRIGQSYPHTYDHHYMRVGILKNGIKVMIKRYDRHNNCPRYTLTHATLEVLTTQLARAVFDRPVSPPCVIVDDGNGNFEFRQYFINSNISRKTDQNILQTIYSILKDGPEIFGRDQNFLISLTLFEDLFCLSDRDGARYLVHPLEPTTIAKQKWALWATGYCKSFYNHDTGHINWKHKGARFFSQLTSTKLLEMNDEIDRLVNKLQAPTSKHQNLGNYLNILNLKQYSLPGFFAMLTLLKNSEIWLSKEIFTEIYETSLDNENLDDTLYQICNFTQAPDVKDSMYPKSYMKLCLERLARECLSLADFFHITAELRDLGIKHETLIEETKSVLTLENVNYVVTSLYKDKLDLPIGYLSALMRLDYLCRNLETVVNNMKLPFPNPIGNTYLSRISYWQKPFLAYYKGRTIDDGEHGWQNALYNDQMARHYFHSQDDETIEQALVKTDAGL